MSDICTYDCDHQQVNAVGRPGDELGSEGLLNILDPVQFAERPASEGAQFVAVGDEAAMFRLSLPSGMACVDDDGVHWRWPPLLLQQRHRRD